MSQICPAPFSGFCVEDVEAGCGFRGVEGLGVFAFGVFRLGFEVLPAGCKRGLWPSFPFSV